jgi:pimeloyl-ACP methyl ester carboxylesterase
MHRLAERYAFFPPNPPRYENDTIDVISKKMGSIPYFIIIAPGFQNPWTETWTLIYCHGNAEDLGTIRGWCRHVAHSLRVNVMAWDYPGYGFNGTVGKCSESSCYDDMAQVYNWCLQQGIVENRIILWGKSLGSGVAVHQAAKLSMKKRSCGGVILQSPFTSAVRVVTKKLSWIPFVDIFDNISKINAIQVPVLIIHGTNDEVVPFSHGQELRNKCRRGRLVEIAGADHNNLENNYADTILCQISTFFDTINHYQDQEHNQRQVCLAEEPEDNSVMSSISCFSSSST